MPAPSAATLAAPLYALRDLVGPGWPGHGPAVTALDDARTALSDVAAALGRTWERAAGDWSGTAATAAADFTAGTAAEAAALANHTQTLSTTARHAGSAVARAGSRLQAIIDRFEQRAAVLAPHLDEPGVAQELQAEAERAISEASAVVEELRAELDRQAGAFTAPAAGSAPAAGMHGGAAGFSAGSGGLAPASAGFSAGTPSAAPVSGWTGAADFPAASGADRADAVVGLRDPGMFGDGVAVRLPDGSTALAPNAVAAGAVRHALTQLGVPYRWGGTTPGVGLDCSGLTQWAYHEAGLDIPRLAQEQDIGKAVSAGSLRPGDLAVWDGHVAMIVGEGTMIEAGDPVKLSPIRTTNAGQGFQGFWRPTV
ncbi:MULTISPECIES: C40 family peptidase [unclassified Mycolicibacterium]|uniref:C40 family peptidase n=1 Tax=unclassified Mycolicibacterium TaxID=2636767 RepID=UPI0013085DC8|nr:MULTISPECIES: C40 family peptidase [unclassified Mycolicibacterium]MUL81127.1 NlpC/P60 family protein [Mycolicibacterium sp. CBMA 329]MUL86893.1 NlpC/P60 family protein [Mycolicibacterium sp. CBMA 331]MUL98823.1 NlpC/P60 family protein [Mycolicibacterium sp. CBMA 334]MUM29104.1 NlpC/P60 family protein [Mycolicibacterium sp. CBMA 295]MUM37190.1 NlpC/P60 family protein [Mycolicibacterium sp. CBMA 247]